MELIEPSAVTVIDLKHLNRERAIAAALIKGEAGAALIDPGPSSTLQTLHHELSAHGLAVTDLEAVLLTHVHLDHAGVTGSLVQESPSLRVYVHGSGVTHLINPERLLKSAARVFGAERERLWGDFVPVPLERLTALKVENGCTSRVVPSKSYTHLVTPHIT